MAELTGGSGSDTDSDTDTTDSGGENFEVTTEEVVETEREAQSGSSTTATTGGGGSSAGSSGGDGGDQFDDVTTEDVVAAERGDTGAGSGGGGFVGAVADAGEAAVDTATGGDGRLSLDDVGETFDTVAEGTTEAVDRVNELAPDARARQVSNKDVDEAVGRANRNLAGQREAAAENRSLQPDSKDVDEAVGRANRNLAGRREAAAENRRRSGELFGNFETELPESVSERLPGEPETGEELLIDAEQTAREVGGDVGSAAGGTAGAAVDVAAAGVRDPDSLFNVRSGPIQPGDEGFRITAGNPDTVGTGERAGQNIGRLALGTAAAAGPGAVRAVDETVVEPTLAAEEEIPDLLFAEDVSPDSVLQVRSGRIQQGDQGFQVSVNDDIIDPEFGEQADSVTNALTTTGVRTFRGLTSPDSIQVNEQRIQQRGPGALDIPGLGRVAEADLATAGATITAENRAELGPVVQSDPDQPGAAFGALVGGAAGLGVESAAGTTALRVGNPVESRSVRFAGRDGDSVDVSTTRVTTPPVVESLGVSSRGRTVFSAIDGPLGKRRTTGAPSINLDEVDLEGTGFRESAAFEATTAPETDIVRSTAADLGDASRERFRSSEEFVEDAATRSPDRDVEQPVSDVLEETRAVPEGRASDIADALEDVDGTVFGSVASRAQAPEFRRRPNDIDVVVDDPQQARQRFQQALDGSGESVEDVFDIKATAEAPGRRGGGEVIKQGRESLEPFETDEGITVNPVEEEAARKGGASALLREAGAESPEPDIGPEAGGILRETRTKDVRDAVSLGESVLGPDAPSVRRFRRAFDDVEGVEAPSDIGSVPDAPGPDLTRNLARADDRGQVTLDGGRRTRKFIESETDSKVDTTRRRSRRDRDRDRDDVDVRDRDFTRDRDSPRSPDGRQRSPDRSPGVVPGDVGRDSPSPAAAGQSPDGAASPPVSPDEPLGSPPETVVSPPGNDTSPFDGGIASPDDIVPSPDGDLVASPPETSPGGSPDESPPGSPVDSPEFSPPGSPGSPFDPVDTSSPGTVPPGALFAPGDPGRPDLNPDDQDEKEVRDIVEIGEAQKRTLTVVDPLEAIGDVEQQVGVTDFTEE